MKQNSYIYLFFFILLFPLACTQRKSAEEAEQFIQKIVQQQRRKLLADEEHIHPFELLGAEQEYRLTPMQRLQIKRLFLAGSDRSDREFLDKVSREAEAIALQIGNDSLLCDTRWDIFCYLQSNQDTAAALDLLQRQAPLVRTIYGEERLKGYYHMLANMYGYHHRQDASFYWLRKARPTQASKLFTWYNLMANNYYRFEQYADALAYADSSLIGESKLKFNNSASRLIKGQALRNLGRTTEAMQWYAATVARIEQERPGRKAQGYNLYELRIFYDYGFLLQQAGRYGEAIPLLTLVSTDREFSPQSWFPYNYSMNEIEDPTIHATRLLAQCYYGTGQKDRYMQYTNRTDSLQNVFNRTTWQTSQQRTAEMYRNQLLSNQLLLQTEREANARRTQYVLLTLVILLTGILIAAAVWWRDRRRRLRDLFIRMAERHADWLEIRSLLTESPHPHRDKREVEPLRLELPALSCEPENTSATDAPQVYRRIFHQVLQIMETDRPFLDPKFDLVTLARLAGTNRTQLSTAINTQAQATFSNWLATHRVNYLIQQIDLEPDLTVDELYLTAGFASRTTFYRQFHQVTGLTPKQYMRERER